MALYATHATPPVSTVKDVKPDLFIAAFAKHLRNSGKIEYPSWADYVKTSVTKELAPYDSDWLFVRAASVIRHVYVHPDIGVGTFRKIYSSKKRRGAAPPHSRLASGKIIRYILKSFQNLGLIEITAKGGRRLTKDGQRELDTVARQCPSSDLLAE